MSLTISIRFVTGYCAAAKTKTDPAPEWPLHPARVYLALAAAYFECEQDDETKAAMRWLESLEPPVIRCSEHSSANFLPPTFVPMNDSGSVGKGGSIQSLPSLKRHRAERLFPRTHLPPEEDTVYLTWLGGCPDDVTRHSSAIARLCAVVSRIGQASSLVQMRLAEKPPENLYTLVPDERGATKLRAVFRTSGTLERAATAYAEPPYRLNVKSVHGYRRDEPVPPGAATTVFDEVLQVFRLEPDKTTFRWMQLETTLALATTLRDAVLSQCSKPIPESISGHSADGARALANHIAIVPLSFVGSDHADGHLLGVGVALPREMPRGEQEQLAEAMDKIADVDGERGTGLGFDSRRFPGLGQWRLIRLGLLGDRRQALQGDTWTAAPSGSRSWASVTPFVFDHHSKSKSKTAYLEECAQLVSEAVSRVVVGANVDRIRVTPISPLLGVPPAYDLPRLKRKDGSARRQLHVQIDFDRPVVGPLLIGAGRFRGYGMCRPTDGGQAR